MPKSVNSHFIPKLYLKGFGFEGKTSQVWVYDKVNGRTYRSSVERAAREKGFYTQEFEEGMAEHVEGPTKELLDKLSRGELLSPPEKWKLAAFVSIMKKRVHDHRVKVEAMIPHAQIEAFDNLEREIQEAGLDDDLRTSHLEEISRLRGEWKDGPPKHVCHEIIQPWVTEEFISFVAKMDWVYLRGKGDQKLVTCDNPFFFFESLGIANATSEFSIPLTGDLALLGINRGLRSQEILDVSDRVIREINRRSIANATRFVFFSEEVSWILPMGKKRIGPLSRILKPNIS